MQKQNKNCELEFRKRIHTGVVLVHAAVCCISASSEWNETHISFLDVTFMKEKKETRHTERTEIELVETLLVQLKENVLVPHDESILTSWAFFILCEHVAASVSASATATETKNWSSGHWFDYILNAIYYNEHRWRNGLTTYTNR